MEGDAHAGRVTPESPNLENAEETHSAAVTDGCITVCTPVKIVPSKDAASTGTNNQTPQKGQPLIPVPIAQPQSKKDLKKDEKKEKAKSKKDHWMSN